MNSRYSEKLNDLMTKQYNNLNPKDKFYFLSFLSQAEPELLDAILRQQFEADPHNLLGITSDIQAHHHPDYADGIRKINDIVLKLAMEESRLVYDINDNEPTMLPSGSQDIIVTETTLQNTEVKTTKEEKEPELERVKDLFNDSVISFSEINDPVTTPQGTTYDRKDICGWLALNPIDPCSKQPLTEKQLVANNIFHDLKRYYLDEKVDLAVIPACLLNKAGNVFKRPVIKYPDGDTFEYEELIQECGPTFPKERIYENRFVVDLIEALAPYIKQHNEKAENNNKKNIKKHPFFSHPKLSPNREKQIKALNDLLKIETKKRKPCHQTMYALSLLIDVLRNKVSADLLLNSEQDLALLTSLKSAKPIIEELQRENITTPAFGQ